MDQGLSEVNNSEKKVLRTVRITYNVNIDLKFYVQIKPKFELDLKAYLCKKKREPYQDGHTSVLFKYISFFVMIKLFFSRTFSESIHTLRKKNTTIGSLKFCLKFNLTKKY